MLGITTYIAAQGFRRELGYLEPILNVGNLNLTLPANQNEVAINPADLVQQGPSSKGFALPDTIPPSFRTCNIARKYTLVLQMGVSSTSSSSLGNDSTYHRRTSIFRVQTSSRTCFDSRQILHPLFLLLRMERWSMGGAELPTYDEAVAEGLESPVDPTDDEAGRRGRFEVDAKHLEGAENWDDERK